MYPNIPYEGLSWPITQHAGSLSKKAVDGLLDACLQSRGQIVTLYIRYVNNAIDRGMFYQYEDKTEDVTVIKGKIDIRDYLCNKLPNGTADKFLCTYSSFELDNRLNRIIKHTCKLLFNEASKANQKVLHHILVKLNDVSDVKCKPSDCDAIRLSRLNGNYRVILSMSKMFLLNQTSSYDISTNESFCFLFPTDLLFEGFIGGFMQNALQGRAKVRLQASEVSLVEDIIIDEKSFGKAFTMRHDILVEHRDKGLFILDAKYKGISRIKGNIDAPQSLKEEARQADLYQMFTYAVKRSVKDVYLLYPMYRLEDEEDQMAEMRIPYTLEGITHNLAVHIVRLPFVFEDDVELTKVRLASVINGIFE